MRGTYNKDGKLARRMFAGDNLPWKAGEASYINSRRGDTRALGVWDGVIMNGPAADAAAKDRDNIPGVGSTPKLLGDSRGS